MDEGVSNRIPKAFRSAAAPIAPAQQRWAAPPVTYAARRHVRQAPKVVPPPKRGTVTEARPNSAASRVRPVPSQRVGPQWVRPELLERGMVVLCQDGARGVIESAFSALDEVYVLKHGSKQAVKLNTNQISFLGEWSDAVEIINSVEVPPDVEAILGTEQLEQLQELAGQAPVHLEAMPQEGAHGAVAQLVIGPSTAKAVKAAVDTIVSHVDGLDYPEASYAKAAADGTAGALAVSAASSVDSCNLVAAGDQWMAPMPATQAAPLLYPPGSPPVMMVPVWPGSAGASLTWAQAGLPMADQSFLGSSASWTDPPQTVEVSVDAEPPPVQEIPLRLDQAEPTKQERPAPAAPPWRNKELPPPPEKKLAPEKLSERQTEVARTGTTVKRYRPSALAGKRRREVNVKQEVEEQDEEAGGLKAAKVVDEDSRSRQHGVAAAVRAPGNSTDAAQDEEKGTVLFWATQQDQFSHLPQLPDGWIRIPSKSADAYYYVNLTTGRATFRSPLDLPVGWVKVISRSTGKEYYWNAEKQISQFELPSE